MQKLFYWMSYWYQLVKTVIKSIVSWLWYIITRNSWPGVGGQWMHWDQHWDSTYVSQQIISRFTLTSHMNSPIFWDITPCSPLKINWCSRGKSHPEALLASCFMLVSCFAYSSTWKMEKTCSSETSVDLQQIMWCYIPEDRTLHNNCYEIFKSYLLVTFSYYLPQAC
jgi:hypothetical protein